MSKKNFLIIFVSYLLFLPIYSTISLQATVAIEESSEAGSYKVILYTEDENGVITEKEVLVTITYPRTVIDEINREGIYAHDFKMSSDIFFSATAKNFIEKAGASAWSIDDDKKIMIDSVSVDVKDEKAGIYAITFQTKLGTKTTVTVLVLDDLSLENMSTYINTGEEKFNNLQKSLFSMVFILLVILPIIAFFILFVLIIIELNETKKALYDK